MKSTTAHGNSNLDSDKRITRTGEKLARSYMRRRRVSGAFAVEFAPFVYFAGVTAVATTPVGVWSRASTVCRKTTRPMSVRNGVNK